MGIRNNFIPVRRFNDTMIVGMEKHLLTKHYSFLLVNIVGNKLKCMGSCKPSEFSITYDYEIRYTPGKSPKVYPINPKIAYHEDIHMHSHDNSLCLFYPADFSWTNKSHLYNSIIPWTHEWFIFYELYQLYGNWLHPSVQHEKQKE